jgi:hypothetical protein
MAAIDGRAKRPLLVCERIHRSFDGKPFPAARSFVDDRRRSVFAFSGVRGGKTENGADAFTDRIWSEAAGHLAAVERGDAEPWEALGSEPMSDSDEPRRLYWVVAGTYQLAKVAWRKVMRAIARDIRPFLVKRVQGEVWLSGGVLIQMRTGRDEAQLQGDRLDGCLIDEVCVLPEESYDQIQNRLTDRGGWLIACGSPRPGTWPKYRIWDEGESDAVGIHHWHTADNPWIPAEEIARKRETLPRLWFKRDFEASWDTFDGLVYSDVAAEPDEHGRCTVIDLQPGWDEVNGVRITAAVDFGLRRPACAVVAEVPGLATDGGPGDVVVDELVLSDVTTEQLAHELANLCERRGWRLANVYADPAGAQRSSKDRTTDLTILARVLRERTVPGASRHVPILAGGVVVPKGSQQRNVLNGIQALAGRIRSMDGHRHLFVSREVKERRYPAGMVGTWGSLTGYKWRGHAGAEEPDKDNVHDHYCDALRYWEVCHRPPGTTKGWAADDVQALVPEDDGGAWPERSAVRW